jgi:hypothetical protein
MEEKVAEVLQADSLFVKIKLSHGPVPETTRQFTEHTSLSFSA